MAIRSARASLLLISVIGAFAFTQPAHAADGPTQVPPGDGTVVEQPADDSVLEEIPPVVRDIVFPVVGVTGYSDGFGDCRDGCTRSHEGIDILTFGWKGVPVVAAHDGTVTRVGLDGEKAGCSVDLIDEDGWTSRYLHLNTDLPGTDFAADDCVAPDIEVGTRIAAGTLIGWVGDTGNAEETVPHLHFEIRDPAGVAVDPYLSLEAARHITFRWLTTADSIELMSTAFTGRQPLVYVIDREALTKLVDGAAAAVRFDVPVMAYEDADPGAARSAIRDFAPDRIIVLTGDDTVPVYMDDLRLLAPIVESFVIASPVPDASVDDAAIDSSSMEEVDADNGTIGVHLPVETRFLTMLTSKDGGTADRIDGVAGSTPGQEVPIIIGGRDAPRDLGTQGVALPEADTGLKGVWWLTAEGWRFTEYLAEVPDSGIAYVPDSDVADETVAFLLSSARSPAIPLWSYNPTSLTRRSL